jgi:hypothetical protein
MMDRFMPLEVRRSITHQKRSKITARRAIRRRNSTRDFIVLSLRFVKRPKRDCVVSLRNEDKESEVESSPKTISSKYNPGLSTHLVAFIESLK